MRNTDGIDYQRIKMERVLLDTEKNLIIQLEDSLSKSYMTSDKEKRVSQCLYCGATAHWSNEFIHEEDCPITLLVKLRIRFDIPSRIQRSMSLK